MNELILKQNISKFKTIHMIGIGGIGMSGLAGILKQLNHEITGSNLVQNSQTPKLEALGIQVTTHCPENIQEQQLVIYSQAIAHDHQEILTAKSKNIPCISYPQAVGMLTSTYKNLIAIAGTHGKSTTTAMLICVLKKLKIDFSCILGTNLQQLDQLNFRLSKNSDIFIIEACEYMDAFLNYHPNISLITNLEIDHFDFFKSEEQYLESFQNFAEQSQFTILNTDYELSHKLKNIDSKYNTQEAGHIKLNVYGKHNQSNALGCKLVCEQLGITEEEFARAILNFKGSARRQELILETDNQKIFSDYGHHPNEIKATMQGFKQQFPNSKICLIYQPHQYSRTLKLLDMFVDCFADCDKLVIPDIYKARDSQEDIENMPVEKFVATIKHPNVVNANGLQNLQENFYELTKDYPVVVVMGAGDIDSIFAKLKSSKT